MKKILSIFILVHILSTSFGQDVDIKSMVDSLRFLNVKSLDITADLYWRIIAKRKEAIPFLIEKLEDTTITNIYADCKKENLNVAEVSYEALKEIGDFPIFLITHIQFDVVQNGCWSFYNYFYNNGNKKEFQKLIKDWYLKEKKNYQAKKFSKKAFTESHKKYNIFRYYKWKG